MREREVTITPEGLEKLKKELEYLITVKRPEVIAKIQKAKEIEGADHNPEYIEAKNEQAFIEGRILALEQLIKRASVIQQREGEENVVRLGSKVRVRDESDEEMTFTIVGSAEADPLSGKISNESPVGRALLGRKVGEEVEIRAPGGAYKLKIISLE